MLRDTGTDGTATIFPDNTRGFHLNGMHMLKVYLPQQICTLWKLQGFDCKCVGVDFVFGSLSLGLSEASLWTRRLFFKSLQASHHRAYHSWRAFRCCVSLPPNVVYLDTPQV